MRKYVIPLAVLVTVGLLNLAAFAAEEGEGGERKGGRAERKKESKEDRRGEMSDEQRAKRRKEMKERFHKRLGLTEDQKKQFDQIMKTHRQALGNWRKEHGEALGGLYKQLKEATREKNEEKIKSLREKMKGHHEARKKLHADLKKRMGEVLSEEQMAKAKEAFGDMSHGVAFGRKLMALHAAQLTAKQKAEAKKILDAAMKKIHEDVLTDEQRERIKKGARRRGGEGAGKEKGKRQRPRKRKVEQRKKGADDAVEVKPDADD